MMPVEVAVEIVRVISTPDPSSTTVVHVVVNHGYAPVWLVDDQWLIWNQQGNRIELSYKRGPLRPGRQIFGYFNPEVAEIPPGGKVTRETKLSWPQSLDLLWNDSSQAAPLPGRYEVQVRVGYGTTPRPDEPELGESIDASVLRWQKEALSSPVWMEVPPYRNSREAAGTEE